MPLGSFDFFPQRFGLRSIAANKPSTLIGDPVDDPDHYKGTAVLPQDITAPPKL